MSIIRSTREVTAEWLTQVLRTSGVLPEGTVVSVMRELCNQVATSGAVYRLRLAYNVECAGPGSLILKLAAFREEDREFYREGKYYWREVMFYQKLSRRISQGVPRCYDVDWDEREHTYHLLIEDSQVGRTQDPLGPGVGQIRRAVDWLASFHAVWWQHPELEQWEDQLLPLLEVNDVAQVMAEIESLWGLIGDRLGERERQLCEKVAREWSILAARQTDSPRTLCHGDFHPMNLFIPENPTQHSIRVIDWQFCHIGVGISDLADCLGMFVHPQSRREWEKELIRRYWEKLQFHGVTGYSFEHCMQDYRIEIAKNLLMSLFQKNIPNVPFAVIVQLLRNAVLAFDDIVGEIGC